MVKSPKKSSKKKARDNVKYPDIKKAYNLKIRQDYAEIDYFDDLEDKDKRYINQFTKEFVNADTRGLKLHKSKALKRDISSKNNARNRDVFARGKARAALSPLSENTISYETDMVKEANKDLRQEAKDVIYSLNASKKRQLLLAFAVDEDYFLETVKKIITNQDSLTIILTAIRAGWMDSDSSQTLTDPSEPGLDS